MRLYITPEEFNGMPIATGLAAQLAQVKPIDLIGVLSRASARVDTFCKRRIGAPPVTSIDPSVSGPVIAGSTILPIASTIGFDNSEEQGVYIGSGATQEFFGIVPGSAIIGQFQGVIFAYPYPGFIELQAPLQYDHQPGEIVTCVYYEICETGSSSSIDVYTEAFLSQEAQIASAHAPSFAMNGSGSMTRIVFLRSYPIQKILAVEAAYSYESFYFPLNAKAVNIEPSSGYYRLPFGAPVLEGSYIRTTYIGGYKYAPEPIREATMLYAADELLLLQPANAKGVSRMTMGKRTIDQSPISATGKSSFVMRAEEVLNSSSYKNPI